MRKPRAGEPCSVPSCFRRAKADLPFCNRCWGLLDDGERAAFMFSAHAPYWGRYRPDDYKEAPTDFQIVELKPGGADGLELTYQRYSEGGTIGIEWWDKGKRVWAVGIRRLLSDYERRTTREAFSDLLYRRRHNVAPAEELDLDAEDAQARLEEQYAEL